MSIGPATGPGAATWLAARVRCVLESSTASTAASNSDAFLR